VVLDSWWPENPANVMIMKLDSCTPQGRVLQTHLSADVMWRFEKTDGVQMNIDMKRKA